MTQERMRAETASLQQRRADQKKHWLRWGLMSHLVAIVLCVVLWIRLAFTGADSARPMILIVLTFVYFGSAFATAAQSPVPRWFRSR